MHDSYANAVLRSNGGSEVYLAPKFPTSFGVALDQIVKDLVGFAFIEPLSNEPSDNLILDPEQGFHLSFRG